MYRAVTQRCHFSGFVCLFVCLLFFFCNFEKKLQSFIVTLNQAGGTVKIKFDLCETIFETGNSICVYVLHFMKDLTKKLSQSPRQETLNEVWICFFFFFYRTVTAIINFALWKSTSWRITILLFFLPLLPHFWNMFPRLIEISLDGAELISRIQPLGADNVTGRRLMETSAFIVMNYS